MTCPYYSLHTNEIMEFFSLNIRSLVLDTEMFIYTGIAVIAATGTGILVHAVIFSILRRWTKKTSGNFDDLILAHLRKPIKFLFPVIFMLPVISKIRIPESYYSGIMHFLSLLLISGISWTMINVVTIFKLYLLKKYDFSAKDNLRARSVITQIAVVERILISIILLIGISSGLMTFEEVRKLGVSILASAGVIGIIAGFAAQKTIATLFAGIQIAISQPFRIDDVVVVENEWGRIEEITLTYVVVKIWDQRRLVLPIVYFLEKPFQNWTRSSSDILGTVFFYTDYTIPVQKIREQLEVIVNASPLWDKRHCSLLVTEMKESTVQLRALVSSADASQNWDLRCEVREKLLEYIQKQYPACLPRIRADWNETFTPGSRI